MEARLCAQYRQPPHLQACSLVGIGSDSSEWYRNCCDAQALFRRISTSTLASGSNWSLCSVKEGWFEVRGGDSSCATPERGRREMGGRRSSDPGLRVRCPEGGLFDGVHVAKHREGRSPRQCRRSWESVQALVPARLPRGESRGRLLREGCAGEDGVVQALRSSPCRATNSCASLCFGSRWIMGLACSWLSRILMELDR